MKMVIIIALSCTVGFHALAELDINLTREIKAWRKGDAPPARLHKFPDGKIDTIPHCDLRVLGSAVGDYISQIHDPDLLAALIFDSRAQPDAFHAASSQLITLKGVGHVARLVAERRKTEPSLFTRSELSVLSQLLQTPYVAIKVARISREEMEPDKAESALQAMRADLQAGGSWADAYRKHSDLHPDMRDRANNPKSVRTLIGFHYDSTVSSSGFDIQTYRTTESLPSEHLRELFRAKRGTHIFRAADGVYLYHIQNYYDNANPNLAP